MSMECEKSTSLENLQKALEEFFKKVDFEIQQSEGWLHDRKEKKTDEVRAKLNGKIQGLMWVRKEIVHDIELFSVFRAECLAKQQTLRKLLKNRPRGIPALGVPKKEMQDFIVEMQKCFEKLEKVFDGKETAHPLNTCPKCGLFVYACKCEDKP